MNETVLIRDLAVILAVSAAVTAVFHRLRQPVVLGYLLAGMIIGPHTSPVALVDDRASITTLGELGVIFLLFSLGLEFSLRKLRRIGAVAIVAGLLEMPAMMWVGYTAGRAFGLGAMDSVFLGALLAISSTTIIVKALGELGLLRAGFARIIIGILIVEDLAAVLILVLLSGLATAGTVQAADILLALGKVVVFVTTVLVVGLLTVPRLLDWVASFQVREVLTVTVLGLCLGVAALAGAFGFSVALGAFLIGAVMAESRHVRLIEESIEPVRDMFLAVFFVAVGLLIDPALIWTSWVLVAVLVVLKILTKFVAAGFGTVVAGYPVRVAVQVGLGLAPLGEFSFIIANLGLATGVMSPAIYSVTVGVSALTTLVTPYLLRVGAPLGTAIEARAPRVVRSYETAWSERGRPAGAPRSGAIASEIRLVTTRAALYAILLGGSVVAAGQAARYVGRWMSDDLVFRGDVTVLVWTGWGLLVLPLLAGLARAANDLAEAATRSVRPEGRVFVRDALRFALAVAGGAFFLALASPVLPRGLPLALVLGIVGVAGAVFWRTVAGVREHAERTLRGVFESEREEAAASAPAREEIKRLAARRYPLQLAFEEVVLPLHWSAANRSIRELGIRAKTGATVVEVVRDPQTLVNPVPELPLEPGDVLLLMGSREQVARAIRYLTRLAAKVEPAPESAPS